MKRFIILILVTTIMCSCLVPLTTFAAEDLSKIDIGWEKYFENKSTNLENEKNNHPRIWLDETDFTRIKGYAQGECSSLWELTKKSADSYVSNGPKEYTVDANDGEMVWMNTQGKNLVALIFAYKISSDESYLNAIYSYIDKISEYPSWSNVADGDNCHLAGNSNFLAFGLAYDWLYDVLDDERKEKIVNNIKTRIEDYNKDEDYGFDSINCHNSIIINTSALVALGAMYEQIPKAEEYMKRIAAKLATLTMEVMPDDGAAFEAVNYSSFTWLGLMQAGLVMRDLLNVDILSHSTFENYAKFSLYSYLPVNGWSTSKNDIFGWGDGTEISNGNLVPVMSFMAKEKQNPYYNYFVKKRIEYAESKSQKSYNWIYPLMFYDANLETKNPSLSEEYPLDFITDDTGYVFLRDSWSGNEAVVHFHSGPIMGNTASEFRKKYTGNTLGTGHNHPDMGSPLIFAEGEWLFDDDNYVTGVTTNHNTLTINGIGQIGEHDRMSTDYPDPNPEEEGEYLTSWQAMLYAKPEIVKNEKLLNGDLVYVVCDLTDIYPDEHYYDKDTKLNKYYRHFVYLKSKKALFVIDDIKADETSSFELRWHPTSQTFRGEEDGSFLYYGNYSKMRLEAFEEDGTEIENSIITKVNGKHGETKEAYVLQLRNEAREWLQATAISWENITLGNPVNSSYTENDGICTFEVDNVNIKVDTDSNEILAEVSSGEMDDSSRYIYYNDFSKEEDFNRVSGGVKTDDGKVMFYRGYGITFRNSATVDGVQIHNEGEEKPDIKVEYTVTFPDDIDALQHYPRYLSSNEDCIDTMNICAYDIWPEKDSPEVYYNSKQSVPITHSDYRYDKRTHKIKILYSAKEDVRTIYIGDTCLGTYKNRAFYKDDDSTSEYYSWAKDESGYFKLGLKYVGSKSSGMNIKVDDVKISKLNENMISVPVKFEESDNILPVEHYNALWIPEGEKVNLNLNVAEGNSLSVKLNNEIYIDSFAKGLIYVTPVLSDGDSIEIISSDKETELKSYTSPYSYQYERKGGIKSAVVLGRFADGITGYVPYSYGIYYSLIDKNVTVGNEDVYKVDIADKKTAVYGNYAIDLYGPYLKVGDKIYYKSYVEYLNEETNESVCCFGEEKTLTIE